MTGITDFVPTGHMPQASIDKYAPLVPAELAVLWTSFGIGTFHKGYLRVVDPNDWSKLVDETYRGFNPLIPIMTTAMGDIIGWDGEMLLLLDYRHGLIRHVLTAKHFLRLIGEERYMEEDLFWSPYPEARERYGVPGPEQCFGYIPILGAGGPEKVENLQILDMHTHIEVIAALMGPLDRFVFHS
ncbi:T6SS immunity protein Tdi1 domain-containing protein [Psychromicrobium xiongbiense]|uniref:T6SS immunity protein Tdi1 domain-containing protein n=1 Tax=Psychromicrobium xiongbiense TaxID=3051184 RepID=UPI0025540218|nr:T6SS immunity protein Tdi1 domain-containing protein [Psychromicrobium sp. YIM S02556]